MSGHQKGAGHHRLNIFALILPQFWHSDPVSAERVVAHEGRMARTALERRERALRKGSTIRSAGDVQLHSQIPKAATETLEHETKSVDGPCI